MRGIRKHFGATVALEGVDLFLEPGEVHALVGENGSGKSTLMRILAGAVSADEGEMKLEGSPYRPANPMQARAKGVAMIYQELALCPDLSVAENILLGMEDASFGLLDKTSMRERAKRALATLGRSDIDVNQALGLLPIGSRQIVEIARAVAVGSRVVILDEPTSSLTKPDVEHLFKVIRTLRDSGHAIVYISHFLDEIEAIADRVTVLRDGRHIATKLAGELTIDNMITLMVGRSMESAYPRSARTPGEVLLSLSDIAGKVKPMRSNLTVRRGEVVGVAGLNGSGRTELLRCIFGLDPIKSGSIKVAALDGQFKPHQRWRQGVGMLSEDRKSEGLALNMSISDNLTLTKLDAIVSAKRQEEACASLIDRVSIKCREPGQAVGELSGGNQQKVAFARLLNHDVDVLLLDEPTRGIDVGSKAQLYALINELALQGKAILMVSSYLPELLGVCDRVAVMHKGVLGDAVPVGELGQESIMREAAGA